MIVDIRHVARADGEVLIRAPISDLDLAPRPVGVDHDKEVCSAVALVIGVVAVSLSGFWRDTYSHLANELDPTFVKADDRSLGVMRLGIETRRSSMRAMYSPSILAMHHIFFCQGFRSLSSNRRRMVSREMLWCSTSSTRAPARSFKVQRAHPSGGFEQARATNRTFSLPLSLRAAPGRGFTEGGFQADLHKTFLVR